MIRCLVSIDLVPIDGKELISVGLSWVRVEALTTEHWCFVRTRQRRSLRAWRSRNDENGCEQHCCADHGYDNHQYWLGASRHHEILRHEGHPASLGGADDPDGVGEGDEAEERVACEGEDDHKEEEGQVCEKVKLEPVLDRHGEGREDEGEEDEEEGGHGGFLGCSRTCRSRGRHLHGTRRGGDELRERRALGLRPEARGLASGHPLLDNCLSIQYYLSMKTLKSFFIVGMTLTFSIPVLQLQGCSSTPIHQKYADSLASLQTGSTTTEQFNEQFPEAYIAGQSGDVTAYVVESKEYAPYATGAESFS